MSVTLFNVSHSTIVSNNHEELTGHYNVDFQQLASYYTLCWILALILLMQ